MELTENIFEAYFGNQINLEELIGRLGIYEAEFIECFLTEMEEAFRSFDAVRVEHLIYALCLWNEKIGTKNHQALVKCVDQLNELLLANWHHSHEDIVGILQKISSPKSMQYLYDAIDLRPQYLSWDDNYAFEKKCIRAIYHIGKETSFKYLDKLCKHSNETIREMAQRQINKLR